MKIKSTTKKHTTLTRLSDKNSSGEIKIIFLVLGDAVGGWGGGVQRRRKGKSLLSNYVLASAYIWTRFLLRFNYTFATVGYDLIIGIIYIAVKFTFALMNYLIAIFSTFKASVGEFFDGGFIFYEITPETYILYSRLVTVYTIALYHLHSPKRR